ncbi:MAG: hypothetical protein ACYC46_13445 [Acidobacteriaceae bacterium]
MTMMPLLWIVWAVLAAAFLATLAYRGTITRYEEDQLFLNEDMSTEHEEQNEIVRKVHKLEPFVRILGGATGAMTVAIISLYVYDALKHL